MTTSPPPSVVPGAVLLGKYRVERVIGEGGMGVVLEATHLVLGHRVAIKVLREDRKSKEIVARFEREARIAASLQTEHVARVSDVGVTEAGEPFLVMELLEGRTLEDELRARALGVAEAVDLVLQACRGVADAHALGLVHRDIKPANLFVTRRRDGSVVLKVLDFGLSKVPDDDAGGSPLTATNATFGTPQYMSPEQIKSAKHVDARTDQHALGCVLYECLTGRQPFQADTLTALAVQIALKMPPPPSEFRTEIPLELDQVVLRALAKDPAGRYADLSGFALAMAPYGGASAADAARGVAAVLRGGTGSSVVVVPPAPQSQSGGKAVMGWSEVMPVGLGNLGLGGEAELRERVQLTEPGTFAPPPPSVARPAPTMDDARTMAAIPSALGPVQPTMPDPVSFRRPGLFQGPLVIGIALASFGVGVALIVILLRKTPVASAETPGAESPSAAASSSAEPPSEEPSATALPPFDVPLEPELPSSTAAPLPTFPPLVATTPPAPPPSAQQPPQSKKKRRHRH